MSSYSTNEFKSGLKVLLDGAPCSIISNESIKPGKGQAFNRVKLRNLITNKILEKTFKSGEKLAAADVIETQYQFLYKEDNLFVFMHPELFEQLEIDSKAMGDAKLWLKEQAMCQITIFQGTAIQVTTENFVELEVHETDPGIKGDTVSGGSKPATLETGAVIKVPLFISKGTIIKIDTRTGEYVSRA